MPIYSWDTGVAIASCVRVKNPYIKKDTLLAMPKPTSMYINSGIILLISNCRHNNLSCEQLQQGLNSNIMTYTFKPFSCKISNLIMTHKTESSMATNHSMIRRKRFITHTVIRSVRQDLAILKMYSIPEFMFSEMETLITKWENYQPWRGAVLTI